MRPGAAPGPALRRRPAHEDAVEGFVAAVERGRYGVLVDGRGSPPCGRASWAAAGWWWATRSRWLGDVSGAPGTLARVVRVEPRTTVLRRSADDTDPVERVIVANASQLIIVTALADPPPRPRLIDRFLVAAYDAGLEPLLLPDQGRPGPARRAARRLRPAGHPVRGDRAAADQPGAARRCASTPTGRVSVLVGHSGVGKSTLVNALIPDADRVVGEVSPVTGRGRHTSSSVVALPLPGGGWIIDTPGLRELRAGHM